MRRWHSGKIRHQMLCRRVFEPQNLFRGFVPIWYIFDSRLQRTKSRPEQAFSFCMLDKTKNYIHAYTYSYHIIHTYSGIYLHIHL